MLSSEHGITTVLLQSRQSPGEWKAQSCDNAVLNSYHLQGMQGYANATVLRHLIAPDGIKVHFCESEDVGTGQSELSAMNVALLELDGAAIHSQDQLFQAFAVALKMPKDWYGDEEYASNANAFLEYLDDVDEWVPEKGHVVIFLSAKQFWKASPRWQACWSNGGSLRPGRVGSRIFIYFLFGESGEPFRQSCRGSSMATKSERDEERPRSTVLNRSCNRIGHGVRCLNRSASQ